MKKIFSMLLGLSLILVGCSSKPDENSLEGMTLNKVGGKLDTEEMELVTPNNKKLYKNPDDEKLTYSIFENSKMIFATRYTFGDKSTTTLENGRDKINEIIKNSLPKDATLIEKKSDFVDVYESKTTGRTYWVFINHTLKYKIESVNIVTNEISEELKLEHNTKREEELTESLKNRVGTKLERTDLKTISDNVAGNGSLTYEVDSEKKIQKITQDFTINGVVISDKKIDNSYITETILDNLLPADANIIDKKGEDIYIYESKKTGLKYKVEWKVTPDNKVSSVEVVEHKG